MNRLKKPGITRMPLLILTALMLLSGCRVNGMGGESQTGAFTRKPTEITTGADKTTTAAVLPVTEATEVTSTVAAGSETETAAGTEAPAVTDAAPEETTADTDPPAETSGKEKDTTDKKEETTEKKEETTAEPEPKEYIDGDYTYYINIKPYLKYIAPAETEKYLLLTNRANPLPHAETWVPGKELEKMVYVYGSSAQMAETAAMAMEAMILEATALGVYDSYPQSGYRSYKTQSKLYEKYQKEEAADHPTYTVAEIIALVDAYSARPGTSEHQTGLAMDFLPIEEAFTKTKFYHYLMENAYRFGYILRYEKNTEDITGYMEEAWHWRFVGREAATYIYENKLTLEEYLEELYPGRYQSVAAFYETSGTETEAPPETEEESTDVPVSDTGISDTDIPGETDTVSEAGTENPTETSGRGTEE